LVYDDDDDDVNHTDKAQSIRCRTLLTTEVRRRWLISWFSVLRVVG